MKKTKSLKTKTNIKAGGLGASLASAAKAALQPKSSTMLEATLSHYAQTQSQR